MMIVCHEFPSVFLFKEELEEGNCRVQEEESFSCFAAVYCPTEALCRRKDRTNLMETGALWPRSALPSHGHELTDRADPGRSCRERTRDVWGFCVTARKLLRTLDDYYWGFVLCGSG